MCRDARVDARECLPATPARLNLPAPALLPIQSTVVYRALFSQSCLLSPAAVRTRSALENFQWIGMAMLHVLTNFTSGSPVSSTATVFMPNSVSTCSNGNGVQFFML